MGSAKVRASGSQGSGNRGAKIQTSCAVVSAPTLDRAFARWCFTVECDRPRHSGRLGDGGLGAAACLCQRVAMTLEVTSLGYRPGRS
jgi:hypothetical protein